MLVYIGTEDIYNGHYELIQWQEDEKNYLDILKVSSIGAESNIFLNVSCCGVLIFTGEYKDEVVNENLNAWIELSKIIYDYKGGVGSAYTNKQLRGV